MECSKQVFFSFPVTSGAEGKMNTVTMPAAADRASCVYSDILEGQTIIFLGWEVIPYTSVI